MSSRRTVTAVLTGAGIGLVNVFAFATAGRGIGVSNAFESAAALTAREVAPDALDVNTFIDARDAPPRVDWEHWLVAGMVAGGYLARRSLGVRPASTSGAVPAALGGALVMAGSRMAGGCTSGHGLTGTAQLAASSWTFTPVMFGAAALAARLGKAVGR